MRARIQQRLTVGKLGGVQIEPGYYVYVGSAFGPGGLRARLSHHCRIATAPHWHIDYLRACTEITAVWYTTDRQSREHQWAKKLAHHKNALLPVPGFGASDCSCMAHLIFYRDKPSGSYFRAKIRRQHPDQGRIRICSIPRRPL